LKKSKESTLPEVYSYHTYYLPFVWDNAGIISMDEFDAALKKDGKWNDISVNSFSEASDEKAANYQTLQYFTVAARKSLFGWDENFVKCYEYPKAKTKTFYYIKSGKKEYKLRLDGIKLKIYNTGIGILTFEAENSDCKTLKEVKEINEYGRRIYATYFDDKNHCESCADMLGIKFDGKDLLSPVSEFQPQNEEECIPDFIRCLFPDIRIVPAIDDRMYVACLVNDAKEFERHLDYKTNDAASKSLYEFIYIDEDGWCSCPTKRMREKLLDDSIYDRWNEKKPDGTIYGISHHSMVCITSVTDKNIIERSFLTIYTHMISVALAQRASILAFDEKISRCSRNFEKNKTSIGTKRIRQLKKLQDSYIAFLNQHMNIEVTCQEQGIELYKMLQEHMYIREEEELLSKELDLLNDAADTANDIRNNGLAIFLTVLFGIISAIPLSDLMVRMYKFIVSLF